MAILNDGLAAAAERLRVLFGDRDVIDVVAVMADDVVTGSLRDVVAARKVLDVVEAALSAEVERRSDRSFGYSGFAQKSGHRTATSLIQEITGQSRKTVTKAISTGKDLAATVPVAEGDEADAAPPAPEPWFTPLTQALSSGTLSRDQFDAIRRGLGEPPAYAADGHEGAGATEPDAADLDAADMAVAWREAAFILIDEAAGRPVEDLAAAARLARDTLDPVGTQRRAEARHASRSHRMWTDPDGQHHVRLDFDDDGAAWWRTIINAALRPRRGPRFVDSRTAAGTGEGDDAESDGAQADDTRTNEQLEYDTILAILRTGAQADPTQAFGDRQPGVRIVVTADSLADVDEDGDRVGVAHFEETGQTLPADLLETYLCNAGTTQLTVDTLGRPLDVGREHRLFTKKQRIAMAARDGGCLGCGAEPSRCEAHHINHWQEHGGRTDIRDGVLLCRSCHMRLHNQKRRIVRKGDEYWLLGPPGSTAPPRLLKSRSLLRFHGLAA